MITLPQKTRIIILLVLLFAAILLLVVEKFGYSFPLIEFLQGFFLGTSITILIGFLVIPVKKVKNETQNDE